MAEPTQIDRRLAVILAADIAGFSAAMERDEEGTYARVKALRRDIVEPQLAGHHGRLIKTTGDGFLAEFASPIQAFKCALAIQAQVAAGSDLSLRLRIGLNLGDVIVENDDIYGEGVNIAARLEALADPGGILVSDKIFREVDGKVSAAFEDRGEQQVKNIARPIRAYAARMTAGEAAGIARPVALGDSKPLPLPDKPSIAVLPFQNMSGDPEQEYFADGMVEDIITALSRFNSLFVIARNSSFTYKGKAVDVKQIGRELGVRYILEGSVRKSANRVRITGQLIDAANGAHVWADKFDGSLEDVFDLQDQITRRVVGAVSRSVEQAEIERTLVAGTDNLGAYEWHLRGRANLESGSPEKYRAALDCFRRAIALDSKFALAYASAASCIQSLALLDRLEDREAEISEGTRLAEQAVALGQMDAESLSRAAFFFAYVKHELSHAERLIDQANTLNPNLASAWRIRGWISLWLGKHEEAIEQLEANLRLDPRDPDIVHAYVSIGAASNHLECPEQAIQWIEKALARRKDHVPAILNAIIASVMLGKINDAMAYGARFGELVPTLSISRVLDAVPFRRAEDQNRIAHALRAVGLRE